MLGNPISVAVGTQPLRRSSDSHSRSIIVALLACCVVEPVDLAWLEEPRGSKGSHGGWQARREAGELRDGEIVWETYMV